MHTYTVGDGNKDLLNHSPWDDTGPLVRLPAGGSQRQLSGGGPKGVIVILYSNEVTKSVNVCVYYKYILYCSFYACVTLRLRDSAYNQHPQNPSPPYTLT